MTVREIVAKLSEVELELVRVKCMLVENTEIRDQYRKRVEQNENELQVLRQNFEILLEMLKTGTES